MRLTFYDLKKKKGFSTSDYKMKKVGERRFAVAVSPWGNKAYRIVGKRVKVN